MSKKPFVAEASAHGSIGDLDTEKATATATTTATLRSEAEAFIAATHLSLDSLSQLCETEGDILEDVQSQSQELRHLRQLQNQSQAIFDSLSSQMSSLAETLAECDEHLASLSRERESLLQVIAENEDTGRSLQIESRSEVERVQSARDALLLAQTELKSAVVRGDMLGKSRGSLDDIVHNLKRKIELDKTFVRQTQCQLAGAQGQLENLDADYRRQASHINHLTEDFHKQEEQCEQQQHLLQELLASSIQHQDLLKQETITARDACRSVEKRILQASKEREDLQASITEIQDALQRHKRPKYDLNLTFRSAASKFAALEAEYACFTEASAAIAQDLVDVGHVISAFAQFDNRLQAPDVERTIRAASHSRHVGDVDPLLVPFEYWRSDPAAGVIAKNEALGFGEAKQDESLSSTLDRSSDFHSHPKLVPAETWANPQTRGVSKSHRLMQAFKSDRKKVAQLLLVMLNFVINAEVARNQSLIALEAQRTRVEHLTNCRRELAISLRVKENEAIHLDEQVISLNINIETMQARVKALEHDLVQTRSVVDELKEAEVGSKLIIAEKTRCIQAINGLLHAQNEEVDRLTLHTMDHAEQVHRLTTNLDVERSKRSNLENTLSEQRAQMAALRMQLDSQAKQAINLNVQLRNLRRAGELHSGSSASVSSREANLAWDIVLAEGQMTKPTHKSEFVSEQCNGSHADEEIQIHKTLNEKLQQQVRVLQQQLDESNSRLQGLQCFCDPTSREVVQHRDIVYRGREPVNQEARDSSPVPNALGQMLDEAAVERQPRTPARSIETRPSSALSSYSTNCNSFSPVAQHIESSPLENTIDPDSLLCLSSCVSSSPSRADTLLSSKSQDYHDDNVTKAIIGDIDTECPRVLYDEAQGNARIASSKFCGARGTGAELRSAQGLSQVRLANVPGPPVTSADISVKLVSHRIGDPSASKLPNFVDVVEDKKAWAQKHPRLWRLVYGKREPGDRAVSA